MTVSNGGSGGDIVFYASEAPVRAGTWRVVSDTTAAGGRRLEQPEAGAATIDPPLANPVHYVELHRECRARHELPAVASAQGRGQLRIQRLGLGADLRHGRCQRRADLSDRDDLGDAGQPAGLHGLLDQRLGLAGQRLRRRCAGPAAADSPPGGVQTIRIQAREDGVSIDQVVLSPATISIELLARSGTTPRFCPSKSPADSVLVPAPASEHLLLEQSRMSMKRQMVEYGQRRLARRLLRAVPWLGGIVALATLGAAIRRKGAVGGIGRHSARFHPLRVWIQECRGGRSRTRLHPRSRLNLGAPRSPARPRDEKRSLALASASPR